MFSLAALILLSCGTLGGFNDSEDFVETNDS